MNNYDYLVPDISSIKDRQEWYSIIFSLAETISTKKKKTVNIEDIMRKKYLSEDIIIQLNRRLDVLLDEEQKQIELLELNELQHIDGNIYRRLKKFQIMYSGWECDEFGWIAENCNGDRVVILTSHGTPYIGNAEDLHKHIAEYQNAIDATNDALAMLTEKNS